MTTTSLNSPSLEMFALDLMKDALIIMTENSIVFANNSFEQLFSVSRDQLIGHTNLNFIRDHRRFWQTIHQCATTNERIADQIFQITEQSNKFEKFQAITASFYPFQVQYICCVCSPASSDIQEVNQLAQRLYYCECRDRLLDLKDNWVCYELDVEQNDMLFKHISRYHLHYAKNVIGALKEFTQEDPRWYVDKWAKKDLHYKAEVVDPTIHLYKQMYLEEVEQAGQRTWKLRDNPDGTRVLRNVEVASRINGEPMYVNLMVFYIGPTTNSTGVNRHLFMQIVEDVTERRKLEKDLEIKQKRLEDQIEKLRLFYTFFENSPILMGEVELVNNDTDTTHILANPAVLRNIGLPPDFDIRGRSSLSLGYTPEMIHIWANYFRESQRNNRPSQFEITYDVKTKKWTHSPIVTPIALVNNKRKRDELDERGPKKSFKSTDNQEIPHNVQERSEETQQQLNLNKCMSVWTMWAGELSGNTNEFWYLAQDISYRKAYEQQLQENKEALEHLVQARTRELEEALHVKRRFLATISHEIRTPMSGIFGALSWLAESPNLTPEQRDMIHIGQVSGEQLLVLINDLLDLTKAEEGKVILESVPFSLIDKLEESLEIVLFAAEKKNLELICDISPQLPDFIFGDPGRIRQILVNLLSNAVKFSSSGEITLSAQLISRTSDNNNSNTDTNGDTVEILFRVSDQGVGIPDHAKDKIFMPFIQADQSITRRYGGSGLGLHISKRLAELMGGTMYFESEEGVGSHFYFSIKTVLVPQQSLSSTLHSSLEFGVESASTLVEHLPNNLLDLILPYGCRGKTVFIVDQSRTVRTLLESRLMMWGIICRTFTSADEVLQLLLDRSKIIGQQLDAINIILIDSKQPLSTIKTIKEITVFNNSITSTTPPTYVGVMGYGRPTEIGNDTSYLFVKKPIRMKILFHVLRELLSYTSHQLLPEHDFLHRPSMELDHGLLSLLPALNPHQERIGRSTERRLSITSQDLVLGRGGHTSKGMPHRILVAEDNVMNSKVILKMLSTIGYNHVTVVENGKLALEAVKRRSFDIVLMDVMMPEMGGLEATELIRKEVSSAQQPIIIALTADALPENKDKCINSGMDCVMTKPVSKDELTRILRRYAK